MKNLHIKLCRSVMGMQMTGMTTIALLVLHTGELKTEYLVMKKHPY